RHRRNAPAPPACPKRKVGARRACRRRPRGSDHLGCRQLFPSRARHCTPSQGNRPQMLTLTIGIGVAVSLALFQITGLSAGGVISPGYIALVLDRPGMLVTILLAAFAAWGVLLLLSRYLFLYGTRRFGMTILIGLILTTGIQAARGGIGPIAFE